MYRTENVELTVLPLLPVLCNVNIGHATPRCIIPVGVHASVDANEQVIRCQLLGD